MPMAACAARQPRRSTRFAGSRREIAPPNLTPGFLCAALVRYNTDEGEHNVGGKRAMKTWSGIWAGGLLGLTMWSPALYGEHATIALRVFRMDAAGRPVSEATAAADAEPPAGGVKARALFKAKAGEPLVLQFIYTNTYPHGVAKGVRIRYFVARVDKVRQKEMPALDKEVVSDGEFHLDFKPKGKVGARAAFSIAEPGIYMLRVDSYNTNSDHEHFAAIDLQVE
jgi:hypothetical protein